MCLCDGEAPPGLTFVYCFCPCAAITKLLVSALYCFLVAILSWAQVTVVYCRLAKIDFVVRLAIAYFVDFVSFDFVIHTFATTHPVTVLGITLERCGLLMLGSYQALFCLMSRFLAKLFSYC